MRIIDFNFSSLRLKLHAIFADSLRRISLAGLLLVPALAMGQAFVQVNSNTVPTNTNTVSVTYTAAETVGHLNVVVVGWSDTSSSVISVVDDNTNTYALAGTTAGHGVSQAIYYAKNISITPHTTPTVTVTFNTTAATPDVRVLEYSGLSTTAPLSNLTGTTGSSIAADSGPFDTPSAGLVIGAGTTGNTFTAPGVGFTSRIITTGFGDIVEDLNGAAGTYSATAALANGAWVMQGVSFSTSAVTFGSAPAVTSVTPNVGSDTGGTTLTITGTGFQAGAVVLFGTAPGGVSALNCTESGGTTISCQTPSHADGAVDVTVINVDGQTGSSAAAYAFQNVTPTISTVTPLTGPTNGGTPITIAGGNFQVGAQVLIGGLPAQGVVVQDLATITANTPGEPIGAADVTVNNTGGGTATKTGGFTYALGTGPINYIQRGGAGTASTTATVVAAMPSPQLAHHANVVIIGWSDVTATVTGVTDTEGNAYVAALPAVTGTGLRQVIWYAKNIVGDGVTPNTVTVTFNQAAVAPDVQILEYSGLDQTSPLDAAAVSGSGNGTLADSGACTTVSPVDVIIGAATVETGVTGAGAGFSLLNITTPNGDNSEHQITSVAGSCEATAPLTTGHWVMQAVAFKAAPAPVPDFTISAAPASRTVAAGLPASYTVTVTAVNGFNSAVALTCASVSLPAGASCSFSPASVTPSVTAATSALTVTTSTSTPVATSTITVTGTSGSLTHNTTVGLTVTAAPDYTFNGTALAPASVTAGATATSTISVAPLNGFTGTVALSCSTITPVLASPPTCTFAPTSITGGTGSSTLTVHTTASTATGLYTVTVAGAGSVNHTKVLTFTVTAALVPDFTVVASTPTPATVTPGGAATSTITIAPVNGFTGTVNLTCAVTPAATRQPTCALNPASVTNGTGTSTLTVSTTAATTASLSPHTTGLTFAMLFPIGGLALLGTGIRASRKKLLGFMLGCMLFAGLIFMAACGGSSSSGGGGGGGHAGTPAGTYTVTVTATSGTTVHTTPVSVVVN